MDEIDPHAPALDTDREIWREREGDFYSPSVHVTGGGLIGIKVAGSVVCFTPEGWHALYEASHRNAVLAEDSRRLRNAGLDLAEAATRVIRTYDGTHRLANKVAEFASVIADEGGRGARSGDRPEHAHHGGKASARQLRAAAGNIAAGLHEEDRT